MPVLLDKADRQERSEDIYRRLLPQLLQEPENAGKIIAIDPESGDYAIGDDLIPAVELLTAQHPGIVPVSKRIGYNVVYAVGGSVFRVDENDEEIRQ